MINFKRLCKEELRLKGLVYIVDLRDPASYREEKLDTIVLNRHDFAVTTVRTGISGKPIEGTYTSMTYFDSLEEFDKVADNHDRVWCSSVTLAKQAVRRWNDKNNEGWIKLPS